MKILPISHLSMQGRNLALKRSLMAILISLAVILISIISGAAIAQFGLSAAIVVIGVFGGLVCFFLPLRYLLVLTVLSAYLLMGQLIYFARIEKALWIPFLFGLILLVRLPADLMRRNRENPWQTSFDPQLSPALRMLIGTYFSTVIASTLINQNGVMQIIITSKEYFFLWGIFFVIGAGLINEKQLKTLWRLSPWLVVLQFPLVLYQRFVIAPKRAATKMGAEWDAVVGVFGGDPNGGGASGAMGLFSVFAMVMMLVLLHQGFVKKSHTVLIVLTGVATLALSEVKFAVLLLPIALLVAFRKDFFSKPIAALSAVIVGGVLTVGLLAVYQAQYSNEAVERSGSGYFDRNITAATDAQFINYRTGEIGRVAAITFWAEQQSNPVGVLIGAGMGASRKGDLATGEAAKRWEFNIARSSLAILLWETGLLGTCAFLLIFFSAFLYALRLERSPHVPSDDKPYLIACSAGLIMLGLELPYNTDIFYSPQMQILFFLILGQLALSGGKLKIVSRNSK